MDSPETLLRRFGLDAFRPGQREAVAAALAGRDCLVVMPTGGGKSLCYQLPALAGDGLVVVVSPLIALMADQSRRLHDAGVPAAMLASGMADGHNAAALRAIVSGEARLVLAAPERFASGAFRDALARRTVSLFVVDEAHCVTEWGHDFRPDYLRLHGAIAALDRPPVMAATATATPRVAREIAARLGLREPVSVRAGFDRPNLAFDVVSLEGSGAVARKRAALLHVLSDPSARPAIVYCGTRRDTDSVAELISAAGIRAVAYHAGMSPDARRRSQEAFMGDTAEVVVATNAFGMGVDKSSVRTVAHWALPTSLEAYYQEAGRGGRDGLPARALLLAARMDLGRLIRFNTQRTTTVADVRAYVAALRRRTDAEEGVAAIGHSELDDRDRVLLSIAERAGAVELQPGGGRGLLARPTGQGSPRLAWAAIKAAKDRGWESYRSIERYMSGASLCRRRQILDHFGDASPGAPSGRCCDVCDPDPALEQALHATPVALSRRRASSRSERSARSGAGTAGQISARRGSAAAHAADPEPSVPAEPVDEDEFERLRRWRYARAEGKPAFTVAANTVLEEILRRRPSNAQALLEIRGIGPAFCAKHGDSLLEELGELWGTPSGAATAIASVSAPT
ncbi:MAG TPA: RecQ family ATP-dependent DNA helicase [Solirubrobacteraceae bacterium]|jgi:RecQ family ATP-dependent DNA helicase|nr:RecQ family ATP-dependent DNA helicase [Solirubrobacteraceae bacterium]